MTYFITALDLLFIYLVYHVAPWPTAVLIYGIFMLAVHVVLMLAVAIRFKAIPDYKRQFSRPIILTFLAYIITTILYLTSSHEIAHVLAVSTTIIFGILYYIRYKTQQLF